MVSVITVPYSVFRITESSVCICIHRLNYFHKVQLQWGCLCFCIVHAVSIACQWHAIVLINTSIAQRLPAAAPIPKQSQGSLFSKQDTLMPQWHCFIPLTWCLRLHSATRMSPWMDVDNWASSLPLLGASWMWAGSGLGAGAGNTSLGAVT